MKHLRETGSLPANHSSHDHLNVLDGPTVDEDTRERWRKRFEDMVEEQRKAGSAARILLGRGIRLVLGPGKFALVIGAET